VRIAIDDATGLASAEVLADEKATTAIAGRTLGIRHRRTPLAARRPTAKAERSGQARG
jgi:hypothetical protein